MPDTSSEKVTPGPFPRRGLVLAAICFGQLWISCGFSLHGPFFPKLADSKGVPQSQWSLVFSAYYVSNFFGAPLYGKIMPIITARVLLKTAIFVQAIAIGSFALVERIEDGFWFWIASMVLRFLEGFGSTAYETATIAILMHIFPEKIGVALSVFRMSLALGFTVGPAVGGVLYDLKGFSLPFMASGIMSVLGFASLWFIPKTENATIKKKIQFVAFLKHPRIIIYWLSFFMTYFAILFNTSTIETHLRPLGYSPSLLGKYLLIQGLMNLLTAIAWGQLCDRNLLPAPWLLICAMTFLLSFQLFIGPQEFLPLDTSVYTIVISFICNGTSNSGMNVCVLVTAIRYAKSVGIATSTSSVAVVSSLFTLAQSSGAFVGPAIGGVLVEKVGYSKAFLAIFCVSLIIYAILIGATVKKPSHLEAKAAEADGTNPNVQTDGKSLKCQADDANSKPCASHAISNSIPFDDTKIKDHETENLNC